VTTERYEHGHWQSIDMLLGCASACSAVTADQIHQYFDDKVDGVGIN